MIEQKTEQQTCELRPIFQNMDFLKLIDARSTNGVGVIPALMVDSAGAFIGLAYQSSGAYRATSIDIDFKVCEYLLGAKENKFSMNDPSPYRYSRSRVRIATSDCDQDTIRYQLKETNGDFTSWWKPDLSLLSFDRLQDETGVSIVTSIVIHSASFIPLMVGFMNPDALQITQESGNCTFWSRTQKKIWMKGETSGNILKVKDIQGAGSSAVRIFAYPTGPVCHTGARTCFEKPIVEENKT